VSGAEPVVSVVLRTYEHAGFVAQAIESVLIQDAPFDFELVIGEDCSSDGTREIVAAYAERYPETIRAVLPERNIGHGAIFERALGACRGGLIAYLDGDDYWTSPSKLRRQVEYLEANPECASCFHDVSLIYEDAGVPSGALSPRLSEDSFSLDEILLDCFIPAPSVMFRRGVVERLPAWTFDVVWIDWLIHICSAMGGPIGYIPEALAAYRVHRGGMFSALDRITQVEEDLPFYGRLLAELPEQRALIERCIAYRHAELAIERLGVPFDACVVLIDPRREMRPYFNGRHARSLPRRDTRAVTELEAIRVAAATLSTANRDYDTPIQPVEGTGRCYVVVPAYAAAWVREHRPLLEYLDEQATVASADEWCTVHELPSAAGGEATERVRSTLLVETTLGSPLPQALAGAFLEAPVPGSPQPAHAVSVCGWVAGREAPVLAIDFEAAGRLLWRTPVNHERPDVADALAEAQTELPGFQTTLNLLESPSGEEVTLLAVFADGTRVPFATLGAGSSAESRPAAINR
jgi:glycosyltransferase involved in cell wall biosynthesis